MRTLPPINSESALTFSGILVTLLVGSRVSYSVFGSIIFPAVALLCLVQLACFSLSAMRRDLPRSTLMNLFWIEALCIATLFILVPASYTAILSIVWIVQSGELFGSRRGTWLSLACLSLFTCAQFFHLGTTYLLQLAVNVGLYGTLMMFALGMVQRNIRESQLREQTVSLNRELIATRELLSQTAAQSERLRIARDLHDILGHHMTALILNLEVANHFVEGKAQEKVQQSQALAKLLLSDLRSTVSELREETPIDLQQSIDRLTTGIPNFDIDVDFSNAPPVNDVELAEILLRCAQEALTNVLRHSTGDHCRIEMRDEGDHCTLSISDNGTSNRNIDAGNGLKGMTKRAESNGGKLSWQQKEDGFTVQVTLPLGGAR